MHLSPLGVRVYTHTRSLRAARVYVTRYARAGARVRVATATNELVHATVLHGDIRRI